MKKFHAVFFTDMSSKIWHVRPLGAYRLASELREHGYQVLVVDFFSKWLQDKRKFLDLLRKIISDETLLVGYSGTFFTTDNAIKQKLETYRDYYGSSAGHWPETVEKINLINRYIKKLCPDVKIFYGGAKSNIVDENLEQSGVDYVVQGFADSLVVNFLQKLQEKKSIPYDINASAKAKIINFDVAGKNFNFANSLTRFHESDCIESTEVLPLETSRGCLFKCKFCAYPLLGRKKNDPDYHKHITMLTDELVTNYREYGVNKYTIIDDTFNESTEKLKKIHDSIKDSGIEIEFSCYLRLDLLERYPEQIKILYDMGLRSCFLGIETLNSKSARSIGKSSEIEKVKATLELARTVWGNDVSIFGSFISGLPHETQDTINDWMQWVYDRSDLIDSYVIGELSLTSDRLWTSEIGRSPEKFGYQVDQDRWVNNVGLSQLSARRVANSWMEKSWKTGRLKVAGWEMMGMQNLGYESTELKKYTLDRLPMQDFADRYISRFCRYQDKLFNYLNS